MEIYGNVSFWKHDSNIEFVFNKIDKKKLQDEVVISSTLNLPFEIWQKFKGNKVKITIEKIK